MRIFLQFLLISIALHLLSVQAQNAPVISAGSLHSTNAVIYVPVTVSGFSNIGSFQLRLLYDPTIANLTSFAKSSLLTGSLAANTNTPGVIVFSWFKTGMAGVNIPDNTELFTFTFARASNGISTLAWDPGNFTCLWFNAAGQALNQEPFTNFYLNGKVHFMPVIQVYEQPSHPMPVLSFNEMPSTFPTPPQTNTFRNQEISEMLSPSETEKASKTESTFLNELSNKSEKKQLTLHALQDNRAGSIRLRYTLPAGGRVNIRIYSQNGQLLEARNLYTKPAGTYEMPLQTRINGICIASIELMSGTESYKESILFVNKSH